MRAFTYLTPSGAAEAVELLDAHAPDARVIAGGQNLLLGMKDRSDSPAVLVSLGGVPELRGVRTADSGELVIGAATTYATLARMAFTGWRSEIASVCGNLADRPVRTMGTIGGAACSADPRYDIPALVIGVGAQLEILSAQGMRTVQASDFFLEAGGTSMQPGDLLTAIRFPTSDAFTSVVFEKFRQRVFDAALASTVFALRVDDGVITDLRLAIGATTPRPTVCVTSTVGLVGQPVDVIEPALMADAAAIEVLGAEAPTDPPHLRYQRELIKSVTRRALIRATATPGADVQDVTITINGDIVTGTIDERTLLLDFIRDVAGKTGTHNGCLEARCGCCSVEVDGDIVKSCNVLALQVAGRSVTTIEGLSKERLRPVEHVTSQSLAGMYAPLEAMGADVDDLHPVQVAFHQCHALQCGFCTPGMVMVMKNYLEENPEPTRDDVRTAIAGNLCRCTGYQHIIDAGMMAAETMRSQPIAAESAPAHLAHDH